MHLFYYGTWLMGVLSLLSVLAIYRNNKRVIRDLKRIPAVKDRWLLQFLQEYQKCGKEDAVIHNPGIYLAKRMRGRKIGPITLRQMKGISWYTFALSFLCAGVGIFMLRRTGLEQISFPVLERNFSALSLLVSTAGGGGIILLLLRMILALGYQEDVIETNLLDYMENPIDSDGKVVQMEKPARKAPAAGKVRKTSRRRNKNQEQPPQENMVMAQKERVIADRKEQEREKKAEQVEERIREAAATDERYSHLLNEEEEAIVKDVIKEFLT